MRRFANLFLMLFPLAAVFGIAAGLAGLVTGFPLLPLLQRAHAGLQALCLFCAVVLYLALAFNRHLPKRLLLPLFLWLFWSLLDYWPVRGLLGGQTLLYASVVQLLLGIIILRWNRSINNRSLLLVPVQFVGPAFNGTNLLRFCLVNILLIPAALVLVTYAQLAGLVSDSTAGFVRLKPTGLYMVERVYRKGQKEIHLAGMIHLGQQDYYQELAESLPFGSALFLTEGVSDRDGLLKSHFGYGKVADLLGLSLQQGTLFTGRQISADELDKPLEEGETGRDILRADIDIQEFDPLTIKVLNALAQYFLNAESPVQGYLEFNRWAQENLPPDAEETVMADLLDKRNRAVIGYLRRGLDRYDTFVIPWGALHMKGLERHVRAMGFIPVASHERQSIDFLLLPYGSLWESITK